MGCGASNEQEQEKPTEEEQQVAQSKHLVYGVYPPLPDDAKETTPAINPNCQRAESKRGLIEQIRTSSGLLLTHCAARTQVEVLFFYPETSYTKDQPPATCVKNAKKMKKAGGKKNDAVPPWRGIRCQFKEFDSFDDIPKRWYEEGDAIPGVLSVDQAGPNGAWATLSPHVYQQRYILPNGARTSCFTDDLPSIPQRIYRCFKLCGGDKFLSLLIASVNEALESEASKLVLMAVDDAVDDFENVSQAELRSHFSGFDPQKILLALKDEMTEEKMGSYETVRQMPAELGRFIDYLSFLEDAMFYNWIEIAVESEMDCGVYYYKKDDKAYRARVKNTIGDTLLRMALTVAEKAADETYQALRGQAQKAFDDVLEAVFLNVECPRVKSEERSESEKKKEKKPDDGDKKKDDSDTSPTAEAADNKPLTLIEELFDDVEAMAAMDLASIDCELMGITDELPDPRPRTEQEIEQLFKQWREEDSQPMSVRRQKCYDATVAYYEKRFEEAGEHNTGQIIEISRESRIPRVIPRHFHTFVFFLVFPMLPEGADPSAHRHRKKPKQATLVLWPEGCPPLETRTEMVDITIPKGGADQASVIVDAAVDTIDQGDDTIDDKEDPRVNWVGYPSQEWRGFKCEVEVAMDINYAFHFSLDGSLFLDHNSFFTRDQLADEVFYRRIIFSEKARRYTCNPLQILGLSL